MLKGNFVRGLKERERDSQTPILFVMVCFLIFLIPFPLPIPPKTPIFLYFHSLPHKDLGFPFTNPPPRPQPSSLTTINPHHPRHHKHQPLPHPSQATPPPSSKIALLRPPLPLKKPPCLSPTTEKTPLTTAELSPTSSEPGSIYSTDLVKLESDLNRVKVVSRYHLIHVEHQFNPHHPRHHQHQSLPHPSQATLPPSLKTALLRPPLPLKKPPFFSPTTLLLSHHRKNPPTYR